MFKKILVTSLLLFAANVHCEPEDWYFIASIGGANNKNPDDVEQVISDAEDIFQTDRVSLGVDLGFYWPVSDDTFLLGVVSNVSAESVHDAIDTNIITHHASHVGISAINFVGPEVGKGLFFRGDLGAARSEYTFLNNNYLVENGTGSAILLGAGYSIAVSGESRVIFSLNFIKRTIGDREFTSSQFTIGGMW